MADVPVVMISSTSVDLKPHRSQVREAILSVGWLPRSMEEEGMMPEDALTYSLRLVNEADYYILILGFRYGSVPKDPRNPGQLSYTELEYRRALERDSMRVSDMMNEVTNVALSFVGHSHYADAWIKLATVCGQNGIGIVAIDMIYNYLLIYQQPTDTRADDFQMTAKCLLKAYEATDTLRTAVSCANAVHGWRGRMAYDLLSAADYLTQTAIQLLSDGNLSYICEKLQHGIRRIIGALHEGLRHSKRPNLFDFSDTHFPAEQDRV